MTQIQIQVAYPDYYTAAVQADLVEIAGHAPVATGDILIERVYDDNSDVTSWIRPLDSDPIQPARPHLSSSATVEAYALSGARVLIASDHAYISGGHIVVDRATAARLLGA